MSQQDVLTKKITFESRDGRIHYAYHEREEVPTKNHLQSWKVFQTEGIIPYEVSLEGAEAIETYAYDVVTAEIAEQKAKDERISTFLRNPDFPVEVEHDGIILRGKIISGEDSTVTVRLHDPEEYQGEKFVIFGFGAAMARQFVTDGDGNFSEHAIAAARRLLIEIYEREKNGKEYESFAEILDRLNR